MMQTMGTAMMMGGHGHSHGGCGPPAIGFGGMAGAMGMMMGHGHSLSLIHI